MLIILEALFSVSCGMTIAGVYNGVGSPPEVLNDYYNQKGQMVRKPATDVLLLLTDAVVYVFSTLLMCRV